jgi:hypothetical protein
VPFLLTRLLRAGSDENPDWIPQWQAELEAMLRSSDDALRAVAAVNAAIGRFPEGSDPRTYDVAQALIQGLRSSSSEVRAASDTGLAQITTSGPCFEPSDPPSLRGAAVREWDAWLAQNKASLEAQRIKQNFW